MTKTDVAQVDATAENIIDPRDAAESVGLRPEEALILAFLQRRLHAKLAA